MLRGISNKREFLATALARSGIIGLLEQMLSARRSGLIVFTYHRIADPFRNLFYDPVISASPESFRTQVQWLQKHFRIIALDELISRLDDQAPCRELLVLLTFDDGYKDNFDVAMPILRELGVPATFFIPPAFLEDPRLPWWDHIAYVLKRTTIRQLVLKVGPQHAAPALVLTLDMMPRALAIMTIIQAFLEERISEPIWFLDQLEAQAEVTVDSESLGRTLFMSWDQVRELASFGKDWTIGSHSHTHHRLASLDDDTQRYELAESSACLKPCSVGRSGPLRIPMAGLEAITCRQ